MSQNYNTLLQEFFDNPLPEGGFQLRELSRKIDLAPTSVKNYLKQLEKKQLIIKKQHRTQKYPIYYANRDNEHFKLLKKLNTIQRIKESGLLDYIYNSCTPEVIILFGSAALGEDIKQSDIDIFVEAKDKKLDLKKFEKLFNRKINPYFGKSFKKISKELKNNLINGVILKGYLEVFE